MQTIHSTRRHDVDWLRTLALGLLILYHLGMYYVADWDWHIKSSEQSEFLQNVMILSNQWRMPLLFFVSGMTLALIRQRYTSMVLLRLRSMRLLVPLLFGMLVIVPPQLYYELRESIDYQASYGQFLLQYLDLNTSLAPNKQSAIGLLTWNHLWYLIYLWVYSLLFVCLSPVFNWLTGRRAFEQLSMGWFAFTAMASLLIVWLILREAYPVTHALVDDWYNHGKYFTVFLIGYLFVLREDIWLSVIRHRLVLLLIAMTTYSLIMLNRHGIFPWLADQLQTSIAVKMIYGVVLVCNLWAWLLALVGFAGRYLNRPNKALSYANRAVLPWYILHQTLIIIAAANIALWDLPIWLEALCILMLTLAGCVLGYEIIRRVNILRFLFGMSLQGSGEPGCSELRQGT